MKATIALIFCVFLSAVVFSQETWKLDEFEHLSCDDYLGRMDTYISEARKDTSSKLYIVIYEGKEFRYDGQMPNGRFVLPRFGSAQAKIRSMKQWFSHRGFEAKRYSFIRGGFREKMTVEFWIVPKGASPPVPTPTLTKLKYLKGKAYGFCTDCCGP